MGTTIEELFPVKDMRPRCSELIDPEPDNTNEKAAVLGPSSIETLPDVELGYLFSFLHWRDKLSLLKAAPGVWRVVNSPLGWQWFQAGERAVRGESEGAELACVERYGHLFQRCTLWLGRPCRNTWECTCIYDTLSAQTMYPLLEAVVDRCRVLKSLRLYHPSHVTSLSCDTEIFKQYQHAIEQLLVYTSQRRRFSLEICGLQYSHEHIRPISLRFLDYYLSKPQALQLVRVLDISRITDSRLQSPTPLTCLHSMPSLTTLKVPIHCVNMPAVQSLVESSLRDLYLLSDDCTVAYEFQEGRHLWWDQLQVPAGRGGTFAVHYIFKQRTLNSDDFVPNPFVKTVCVDSPCKPLTGPVLTALADLYGRSMTLFGIAHSMWEPDMRVADLSEFAGKCRCLTHFFSTVGLSSALVLSLLQGSSSLQQVDVVAGQGSKRDELLGISAAMSRGLKKAWRPHVSPHTFRVDVCELSFLLEEFLLRGYNGESGH